MEEEKVTTKEMLKRIQESSWEGKGIVSEMSTADEIEQAYFQMMHAEEKKATKNLDKRISEGRKRTEQGRLENVTYAKKGMNR